MKARRGREPLVGCAALAAAALAVTCSRSTELDAYVPATSAPVTHGVAVQVVDAATRKPVADAIVTLVAEAALRERGQRALEQDWRGVLALAGRSWRTDAHGAVKLPYDRARRDLFAWGDGARWGRVLVDPGAAAPITVALAPSRALVVQVVDEKRQPVPGATVLLEGPGAGIVFDRWRATTDADGRASIRPIDLHVAPVEPGDARASGAADRKLALSLAGEESTRVEVDLDALPERPVELVTAGRGKLELQLRTGAFELLDVDAVGLVRCFGQVPRRGVVFDLGSTLPDELGLADDDRATTAFEHGRALLAAVPLHSMFQVEVWWGARQLASATIEGPTAPGETRSVPVSVADPPRLEPITGRAVTADGQVAERSFALVLEGGRTSDHERRRLPPLATGHDGRFTFSFREIVSSEPSTLHLYAFAADGRLELEGSFEVPTGDAPCELRDVHVGPPPFLVGGTAVDERGEPVAGAVATVRVAIDPPPTQRGYELVFYPELAVATDERGAFQIFGRVNDGLRAVRLSEGRHTDSPWMEFTPGMPNLLLTVARRGALAGRLLLPADVSPSAMNLSIVVPSQHLTEPDFRIEARLAADGAFLQDDLPLGAATVTVWLHELGGRPAVLSEVAGVAIAAESTNRDPRLAAIDLRDAIHVHRVEFVDGGGAPIEPVRVTGRVTGRETGDDGRWFSLEAGSAGLTLYATRSLPELRAHAQGCRIEAFDPNPPATRVVLRPGFPVGFQVDPATPLPDESYALEIGLTRADDHADDAGYERPELASDADPRLHLDASAPVHATASAAGRHILSIELMKRDAMTDDWFKLASEEREFDVAPQSEEAMHSLRLSDEQQEAIREEQRREREAREE